MSRLHRLVAIGFAALPAHAQGAGRVHWSGNVDDTTIVSFCGCPYTYAGATGHAGKVFYYVCQSVNRHGKASACPLRRVPAPRLHLSVLHRLHHVTTHQTALHGLIATSGGWGTADADLKAQRGQLGKQKQLWEMKRANYGNAIGEGRALATLLPALEKAEAQLAEIAAQMQSADAQIEAQTTYRPTAARLAVGWGRLFDVWGVLTEEERAELLGAIVDRVSIDDKKSAAVDFVPFQEANTTTALLKVQAENLSGSGERYKFHSSLYSHVPLQGISGRQEPNEDTAP